MIEYIFDCPRYRCLIVDANLPNLQYGNFTLLLAGVVFPRINPRNPDGNEPLALISKIFVETRVLDCEKKIRNIIVGVFHVVM